jgi:hypothetical protein
MKPGAWEMLVGIVLYAVICLLVVLYTSKTNPPRTGAFRRKR